LSFVPFLDEPSADPGLLFVQNAVKTVSPNNETISVTTLIVEQNDQSALKVVKPALVVKLGRTPF
jgi:ABC-type branched-subunit amino acid transport system ATPase component